MWRRFTRAPLLRSCWVTVIPNTEKLMFTSFTLPPNGFAREKYFQPAIIEVRALFRCNCFCYLLFILENGRRRLQFPRTLPFESCSLIRCMQWSDWQRGWVSQQISFVEMALLLIIPSFKTSPVIWRILTPPLQEKPTKWDVCAFAVWLVFNWLVFFLCTKALKHNTFLWVPTRYLLTLGSYRCTLQSPGEFSPNTTAQPSLLENYDLVFRCGDKAAV